MIVILSFLLGLGCICAGVWMICMPAGIIAAGVSLVALAAVLSRGGESPETREETRAAEYPEGHKGGGPYKNNQNKALEE